MVKELEFSIHGLPWTQAKINKILKSLKIGGSVTFAFGFDDIKYLKILNEQIFSQREDILFHIWSVTDKQILTKEEITLLSEMNFVRRLQMNGFTNTSLIEFGKMPHVEELKIDPLKKFDISFLEGFIKLKKLSISKVKSLDILETNTALEYLYLSTTVDSYQFAEKLTNLKKVIIDSCSSIDDFRPLTQPSLEYLGLHSIAKLDNIDTVASFSNLKELHLDATHIKLLPSFERLQNLEKLELRYMKSWENPEVLKSMSALKYLKLQEINAKLKAEDFYFLKDIATLEKNDFEYIDFNKKRRQKLYQFFEDIELSNIVVVR